MPQKLTELLSFAIRSLEEPPSETTLSLEHHFRTMDVSHLFKLKAQEEYEKGNLYQSAGHWIQSQSVTFSHLADSQYGRRRKLGTTASKDIPKDSLIKDSLASVFDFTLPINWTVLQINSEISFETRFKSCKGGIPSKKSSSNFGLYLSLLSSGTFEDVTYIYPYSGSILSEFHNIMTSHCQLYKASKDFNKGKYKATQSELDFRLSQLLFEIQNDWIGYNIMFFLGRSQSLDRRELLSQKAIELNENSEMTSKIIRLLDAAAYLSDTQLQLAIQNYLPGNKNAFQFIKDFGKTHSGKGILRHPVILILDADVQHLPWESLSIFDSVSVSRIPSLPFLVSLYEKHKEEKFVSSSKKDIYYVLNPDQNLEKTQERLESFFKEELFLDGVSGSHPSFPSLEKALQTKDTLLYCGHGSSLKNLPFQELEKMSVKAKPLLLGCRSGSLERLGRRLDPIGTATSYMIATAPALLGFLWSVTDRDVDEWTTSFLRFWLSKDIDLVQAVANHRKNFKLFLNQAAAVVYGLPSFH